MSLTCLNPKPHSPHRAYTIEDKEGILKSWISKSLTKVAHIPPHVFSDAAGNVHLDVSFHVMGLRKIDTCEQTFECKLFICMSWRIRKDLASHEPWIPDIQFINSLGKVIVQDSSIEERIEMDGNTRYVKAMMIYGTFAEHFELQHFPLDKQRLHIRAVLCPVG